MNLRKIKKSLCYKKKTFFILRNNYSFDYKNCDTFNALKTQKTCRLVANMNNLHFNK